MEGLEVPSIKFDSLRTTVRELVRTFRAAPPSYADLAGVAVGLARRARLLMENARLSLAIKNVLVEISQLYPLNVETLPVALQELQTVAHGRPTHTRTLHGIEKCLPNHLVNYCN